MAYSYKVLGQDVVLELDPSVVAVRFQPDLPRSARAEATEQSGAGPFSTRFEIPGEHLTIVPVAPPMPGQIAPADTMSKLNVRAEVSQTLPVFCVGGNQVVAADRVIVGLKSIEDVDAITEKYGLTLLDKREKSAVFEIAEKTDIFALCALLDSDPIVRFSEPDFITIGKHIPSRSGSGAPDAASLQAPQSQYAMKITQTDEARMLHSGSPEVSIAILDEGVDTKHRDLSGAIRGTYDGIDNDSYQEPNSWDGHGTACAGLAAGAGSDDHGVLGSGMGCSIVAVRIASSTYSGGPWVTSNSIISGSIGWAWRNGASVLSNSWGGGAPSNEIAESFEDARTRGRDGRGCVVVAAAGNSNGPVQFPGTLPNIITVSASNEFDKLKTPTSADGETWWGTCYGPEISIAAPGVHNLTTDISGSSGYADGDYIPNFNGTSSSTPIVAGACALVISCNPNLREDEVRA